MTDEDIKAGLALCEAATPGPWDVADDGHSNCQVRAPGAGARTGYMDTLAYMNTSVPCAAEARFIAQARTLLPEALRALQEAREELAEHDRTFKEHSFTTLHDRLDRVERELERLRRVERAARDVMAVAFGNSDAARIKAAQALRAALEDA